MSNILMPINPNSPLGVQVALEKMEKANPSESYLIPAAKSEFKRHEIETIKKQAIYNGENTAIVYCQALKFHKGMEAVSMSRGTMPSNDFTRSCDKLKSDKQLTIVYGKFERGDEVSDARTHTYELSSRVIPTQYLLQVDFEDEMAFEILPGIVHLKRNALSPVVYLERKEGNKRVVRDARNDKEIENFVPSAAEGWKSYRFFEATSAAARKGGVTMLEITDGESEIEFWIDRLTHCASQLLREKVLSKAGLIKAFARLFQWVAYNKNLGEIDHYVLVKGVLGGKTVPVDGWFVTNVGQYASGISSESSVDISFKELIGDAAQQRSAMVKGVGMLSDDMEQFLSLLAMYGYDVEHVGDISKPIAFIADEQAFKAEVGDSKRVYLSVLSPMNSMAAPVLNTQSVSKLINSPNFDNIMLKAYGRMFDDAFWFTSADAEDRVPEISEFEGNIMAGRILSAVAPGLAYKIPSIFFSAVRTAADAMLRKLGKLNLPLDPRKSANLFLMPDYARIFGIRLLKHNEVFYTGAPAGKKAVGLRTPSPIINEYGEYVIVGRNEMKKRILAATKGNMVLRAWLLKHVLSMSMAFVMVSGDLRAKALLGGADFDGDMMCLIWDEEVVEAFLCTKQLAIDSEKPVSTTSGEHRIDLNGMIEAFLFIQESGSNRIGTFVNAITRILEAYTAPFEQQSKTLKAIHGTLGKSNYVSKFTSDRLGDNSVKVNEVQGIVKEMTLVNFDSQENCTNVLFDMMIVGKTLCDRVIDAAKTSDKVEEFWKVGSIISSPLFNKYAFAYGNSDGKMNVSLKLEKDDSKTFDSEGNLVDKAAPVLGKMGRIRLVLIKKLMGDVNDLFASRHSLGNEEIAMFNPLIREFGTFYKALSTLKKTYQQIAGMKALSGHNYKPGTEEYRQATMWASEMYVAINHSIRMLASNYPGLTEARIGALVLAYSMSDKSGKLNPCSSNSFAIVCAAIELVYMAIKSSYAEIKQARTRVFTNGSVNSGDVVDFDHGLGYVNGNRVGVSKKRINGKCTIEIDENGKEHAVADITELLAASQKKATRVVLRVATTDETEANKFLTMAHRSKKMTFKSGLKDRSGDFLVSKLGSIKVVIDGAAMSLALDGKTMTVVSGKVGSLLDREGKKITGMVLLLDTDGILNDYSAVEIEQNHVETSGSVDELLADLG